MKRIFSLKPWQLFLLIPPTPLLFAVVLSLLSGIIHLEAVTTVLTLVLTLLMILTYFGWIWSCGLTLNRINQKRNSNGMISLIMSVSLLLTFIATPILRMTLGINHWIIMVIQSLAFIGFCAAIFIVAAAFKKADQAAFMNSSSLISYAFRIWMLPIGVWTLQPRIQALVEKGDAT